MIQERLETEEIRKEYEVAFLVRDEGEASEVSRLVGQHGGEVTLEGSLRKISLAYPIKKELQACFAYMHVRFDPRELPSFEHALETNIKVLRALVVKSPFVRERMTISPKIKTTPAPSRAPESRAPLPLSNEALEKKIEEILQ